MLRYLPKNLRLPKISTRSPLAIAAKPLALKVQNECPQRAVSGQSQRSRFGSQQFSVRNLHFGAARPAWVVGWVTETFNALRPAISLQAALLRDSKRLIRTPAKMPFWGPSYLDRGHKTRGFF
jgi:hypothetical protein